MYLKGVKRMWTSITSRHLMIVVMTAVVCLATARCAICQDASGLSDEIKKLGRGWDDFKIVEELAKTPQISTRLLVSELHPISETRILNGQEDQDAEHVLWCIRALRYLTGGKEFCAKTDHRFGSSEEEQRRKYWIYFHHKTCASFFAMWPSRGSEYIAPEDAQKVIIEKWRDWFAKEGDSFDYKPLHDPKPEDWLW
jgi:hypothetical protein